MRILLFTIALMISNIGLADEKENVALEYFKFIFYEDQVREQKNDELISKPLVSSFYSKQGHRMIIVSASISSGKSYFALMSVNELNMSLLKWKQRGYGSEPEKDVAMFMENNGEDFNFDGW